MAKKGYKPEDNKTKKGKKERKQKGELPSRVGWFGVCVLGRPVSP